MILKEIYRKTFYSDKYFLHISVANSQITFIWYLLTIHGTLVIYLTDNLLSTKVLWNLTTLGCFICSLIIAISFMISPTLWSLSRLFLPNDGLSMLTCNNKHYSTFYIIKYHLKTHHGIIPRLNLWFCKKGTNPL